MSVEAIKKALEGVTHAPGKWEAEGTAVYCDDATGQRVCDTKGEYLFWSEDQKRNAAVYIAAANPFAISELLSTLESLQRENERLRQFLFPYADRTDISGISWDGKYLIGDKASITAFHEMKNRGEQIDVYKRAYDQNEAALKARAEAAEAEVKRLREALSIINAGHACPMAVADNALRDLASTGGEHHAE
ncbi:hypothetical protein [Agrobacterium tumefaciens]|uniref:hypothetical protein n=1 Tax=Agrobacterium tumefaciens TaxID=358 RepID=UPI003BA007C1